MILLFIMLKILQNANKFDNLCLVFNDLDAMFQKSGENKYLIFCSTEKNKAMLENYFNIFDEIAKQIESMTDDNMQYSKDILEKKFKTNDDLPFNEVINIPVCLVNVSSIFKKVNEYYPQVFLYDCYYECDPVLFKSFSIFQRFD